MDETKNKIYLVIEYDYDTGPELHEDSAFPPKAFLSRTNAEVLIEKKGRGEIFEYEIEDFGKQIVEDLPRFRAFRKFVAELECTKADPLVKRFEHAVIGVGTEAGELLTEMKKTVIYNIYNGEINLEKVEDESCDLLHYFIMLTNMLGISLDKLIELNIVKLKKRFPDGYSKAAWLNRDKNAEKEAMRSVKEGKGERKNDKEEN